ncbi:hypothetical protein KKE26_03365 [bacterium]|nr:hypothetical protein [bacterium]MBU1752465.1 hypothetical protein [bacterium]
MAHAETRRTRRIRETSYPPLARMVVGARLIGVASSPLSFLLILTHIFCG